MSSFGELVKQHRERSGMNKQTLAKCLGIHPDYLKQLERGEAKSPGAIIVARMVAVLHLTPFQAIALLKALREDAESDQEPSQFKAM